MKLLEHQGKQLLNMVGIKIPPSILLNSKNNPDPLLLEKFLNKHKNIIFKAQVIGGGRKKAGLILEADSAQKRDGQIKKLYGSKYRGAPIDALLVEPKLDTKTEYFLSIVYDTIERRPMVLFSASGGIEIEKNTQAIITHYPSRVTTLTLREAQKLTKNKKLAGFLTKAYKAFIKFDCLNLEINPIIATNKGLLYAADAKITIDDAAVNRQKQFQDASDSDQSHQFSTKEMAARKIDQDDHRGVAGKTFIELTGDIAVLASGGGASLVAMDALIEAGGQPANYTEYSGNPPREKVRQLTEITLSKSTLNGCLVIGGVANFTDIFETLSGFAEGIKNLPIRPKYPIVVRRAGPHDQEAFAMLKKFASDYHLDITLFGKETPMSYAAKIMAEKAAAYKQYVRTNS